MVSKVISPEKHLAKSDPELGAMIKQIVKKMGPFKIEPKETHSLFVSLAEAIVYQQLSGKAAATIYGRVCALFPNSATGPTAQELRAMDEALLRGAGLSAAKTKALKDLAEKSFANDFPTLESAVAMSDEALVQALTKVRGIGPWTVQMFLMFRLGRMDVLPVDDYGVRKGYAKMMRKRKLPTPKELQKAGEKWAPYRTVASWYLWRVVELE